MPDFVWKAHDSGPTLTDSLTVNGQPIRAEGATLAARFRSLTSATVTPLTGTAQFTDNVGGVAFTPSTADTSQPSGNYIFEWVVTFASGQVQTFPPDGYLWGRIEPNAATAPQLIVSLEDVKEHIGIAPQDRTRDAKLTGYIKTVTPLIEAVIGPVAPKVYEEWHDGGSNVIQLLRIPSSGFGTSPLLTLIAASEYRGPIEYPLSVVASPAFGSIYSVMLNPDTGTMTRRTAGGRTLAFMPGREAIHVWYQAGQSVTPDNVAFAAKECARIAYEWTRQVGRGSQAIADGQEVGAELSMELTRMIRMMLAPTRRAPSLA